MKKLLCLCLAAWMLLGMCACHRDDGTVEPPPAVSQTVGAEETTPPEQAPDQPASPSGS